VVQNLPRRPVQTIQFRNVLGREISWFLRTFQIIWHCLKGIGRATVCILTGRPCWGYWMQTRSRTSWTVSCVGDLGWSGRNVCGGGYLGRAAVSITSRHSYVSINPPHDDWALTRSQTRTLSNRVSGPRGLLYSIFWRSRFRIWATLRCPLKFRSHPVLHFTDRNPMAYSRNVSRNRFLKVFTILGLFKNAFGSSERRMM
jgi:hypothetical protein